MKTKTPQAVDSCHALLLWIIPLLDNFPRNRRFSIGTRIEDHLLDVLEALLNASWSKQKQQYLFEANSKLEVLRHLWRLCYELQVISTKRYEHGFRLILDLGKQIGGWSRYSSK